MKHLLVSLSFAILSLAVAGCKKSSASVTPDYTGTYNLNVTNSFQFAGKTVLESGKGTLIVAKNTDGTYTFTEKMPAFENTYSGTATGTDFKLETKTERVQVDGVGYMAPHTGFGQFMTNGVKITRVAAFQANAVVVTKTVELNATK